MLVDKYLSKKHQIFQEHQEFDKIPGQEFDAHTEEFSLMRSL